MLKDKVILTIQNAIAQHGSFKIGAASAQIIQELKASSAEKLGRHDLIMGNIRIFSLYSCSEAYGACRKQ